MWVWLAPPPQNSIHPRTGSVCTCAKWILWPDVISKANFSTFTAFRGEKWTWKDSIQTCTLPLSSCVIFSEKSVIFPQPELQYKNFVKLLWVVKAEGV